MATTILSKEDQQIRIHELAVQIHEDYPFEDLLLVIVLKGGFIFGADLLRELWSVGKKNVQVDFIQYSSYGGGVESSRKPDLIKDLSTDIKDKHVLVVEDIVDTGWTLSEVLKILGERGPASLQILAMFSKPDKREVEIPVKYIGQEVGPDDWLSGGGIDTDEELRGMPDVVALSPDEQQHVLNGGLL